MAEGINYSEDLNELDRIWPLGKLLNIPEGGTVLVAGAYEGRYMHYVADRYKPNLIVGFEPQKDKAAKARERLKGLSSVTMVIDEGIGVHACMVPMEKVGTDGCRVANYTSNDMFRLNSIDHILDGHGPFDLFICNMEGYEVPLLSYLCATGRMSEIKSLAVQFHGKPSKLIGAYGYLAEYYGIPLYNDYPTWSYYATSGLQR